MTRGHLWLALLGAAALACAGATEDEAADEAGGSGERPGSAARGTTGAGGFAGAATASRGGADGGAGAGAAGGGGDAPASGATAGSGGSGRADAGVEGGAAGGTGGPVAAGPDRHGTVPGGGGIKESARAFEDRVYELELTIAPADWDRLNRNAEAYDTMGTYIPAQLRIDGQNLGQVGLRYKGAWGTFRTCLQGATGSAGGTVPSTPRGGDGNGNGCTNQFPFKVAFDQFDPAKRWNGLKKVNLHSLIRDRTKLHERLTFQVFREMGIATARSTHAKVTLAVGAASVVALYALTENVSDGRFTADRWPADANGNLYKQGWPRYVTAPYWQQRLETNNDAMPPVTHDKVLAFAREVYASRANPEAVLASLHKWSDVEWLARYLAVDTVSNNTDGVTKFWCRQPSSAAPLAPGCANNNYFWYQTRTDKFLLVPWDVDYTWELRPDHYVIPAWDAAVADCTKPYALYGADHMAPSCDPIFAALNLPAARALYLRAIREMLAGPLDIPKVHATLDRWAAQLRPVVMATRSGTLGGITVQSALNLAYWESQVRTFKTNVQVLRDRIAGVVDGKPFRP